MKITHLFAQLSLFASLALTACGSEPRVPSAYAGSTRLVVANADTQGMPICELTLHRDGDPNSENWLGTGSKQAKIQAGGQREFAVASGTYLFVANVCAPTGKKYLSTIQALEITGPTFVNVNGSATGPDGMRAFAALPPQAIPMPNGAGAPADGCLGAGSQTSNPELCCGNLASGTAPNFTCE